MRTDDITPRVAAVLATLCAVLAGAACGSRDAGAAAPTVETTPVAPERAGPTPSLPGRTGSGAPVDVAASDPEATVMATDVPALAARAVCVQQPSGTFRAALVRGSIAGVYDDTTPLRLAHLNWMGPDSGGCVSYPGASTRSIACGAAGAPAAPIVTHVLCQQ